MVYLQTVSCSGITVNSFTLGIRTGSSLKGIIYWTLKVQQHNLLHKLSTSNAALKKKNGMQIVLAVYTCVGFTYQCICLCVSVPVVNPWLCVHIKLLANIFFLAGQMDVTKIVMQKYTNCSLLSVKQFCISGLLGTVLKQRHDGICCIMGHVLTVLKEPVPSPPPGDNKAPAPSML